MMMMMMMMVFSVAASAEWQQSTGTKLAFCVGHTLRKIKKTAATRKSSSVKRYLDF